VFLGGEESKTHNRKNKSALSLRDGAGGARDWMRVLGCLENGLVPEKRSRTLKVRGNLLLFPDWGGARGEFTRTLHLRINVDVLPSVKKKTI